MNIMEKKIISYGLFNNLVWIGMSSYFSILFTSKGLLTRILQEEKGEKDAGPFQFTVVYATAILLTIVYRSINMKIKSQCLIFSSFLGIAYLLNWAVLHAQHPLIHILSVIAGVMVGIPYSLGVMVTGRYLAILCEGQEQDSKAFYFSLYGLSFGSSTVLSALVSIFSLGLFGSDIFLGVLIALAAFTTILGFFIIEDVNDPQQSSQQSNQLSEIWSNLRSSFVFYPSLWNILFVIILLGIQMGIKSSTMMYFLPRNQSNDEIASISLISYGVGGWLFGYICVKLNEFISLKSCGYFVILLFALACCVSALTEVAQQIWVSFLAIFLWGAFSYGGEGFLNLALCKAYNKPIEGYVINMQLRKVFSLFYSFACTLTNNSTPVPLLMIAAGVFAFPAFFCLQKWEPKCDIPESEETEETESI